MAEIRIRLSPEIQNLIDNMINTAISSKVDPLIKRIETLEDEAQAYKDWVNSPFKAHDEIEKDMLRKFGQEPMPEKKEEPYLTLNEGQATELMRWIREEVEMSLNSSCDPREFLLRLATDFDKC